MTDSKVTYMRTLISHKLQVVYLHDETHKHSPNTLNYEKLVDVGASRMINIIFQVTEAEATSEMEVEDSARCILVVHCRKM